MPTPITLAGPPRLDDAAAELLARLGLSAFRGREGLGLTEALVAAGYARSPDELRARYQEAPGAIDRYVQAVNVERLISEVYGGQRDLRSAQAQATAAGNPVPLVILSAAAGAFLAFLVS